MTTTPFLLQFAKSTLRKRLLAYFFTNPGSSLYLREIALLLNADPANLSRELSFLEKEGIFVSKKQGIQKYFSLDKKYALYEELRSMIFKTTGPLGALQRILKELSGIQRAFIYGSFARREERAGSDIDLCLVINPTKFKEESLLLQLERLEQDLGREINYTFFTESEWKTKQASKDSFVTGLLTKKKIELIHEKD